MDWIDSREGRVRGSADQKAFRAARAQWRVGKADVKDRVDILLVERRAVVGVPLAHDHSAVDKVLRQSGRKLGVEERGGGVPHDRQGVGHAPHHTVCKACSG